MMEEQEKPNPKEAAGDTPPDSETGSNESVGVPPEGSLGLLALGAVGITEWRYARERAKRKAEEAEKRSRASEDSVTEGEGSAEDE